MITQGSNEKSKKCNPKFEIFQWIMFNFTIDHDCIVVILLLTIIVRVEAIKNL